MALVSEHLSSILSNVVAPRRTYRRRPKLVPSKTKRFTRARINLNQIWPHLEGDYNQQLNNTATPLHSSSSHNVKLQQSRTSGHCKPQGDELFNYTLENIDNMNNFNHFQLQHEHNDSETNEDSDKLLQKQIHFYTSCSSVNFKRLFDNLTPPNSPAMPNSSSEKSVKLKFEFPMVTLDDLATVLGECENDIYSSEESRRMSENRIRHPDVNSEDNQCTRSNFTISHPQQNFNTENRKDNFTISHPQQNFNTENCEDNLTKHNFNQLENVNIENYKQDVGGMATIISNHPARHGSIENCNPTEPTHCKENLEVMEADSDNFQDNFTTSSYGVRREPAVPLH